MYSERTREENKLSKNGLLLDKGIWQRSDQNGEMITEYDLEPHQGLYALESPHLMQHQDISLGEDLHQCIHAI